MEAVQEVPQDLVGRTTSSSVRPGRPKSQPKPQDLSWGQPVRVAAYVRTSTAHQAERYGPEAQLAAIQKHCAEQSWVIVATYQDQVSGAKVDEDSLEVPRPDLMRCIAEAPQSGIALIVMAESSRLARDDLARAVLRRLILKANLDVRSVAEPSFTLQKTRPSDALLNGVLAAVSEFERLTIAARTSAGRRAKASRGEYSGGQPPFGYRASRGSGVLTVDEGEAETIRLIFRLRDRGPSALGIAKYLNGRNIPTREGAAWTHVQVLRVLRREDFYRARRYSYAGTEATVTPTHPPILT